MNRLFGYLASAILVGGLVIALVQCSDSQCGNGSKEGSEQCDNGSLNGATGNGCSAQCTLVSIPRATLELDVSLLAMEGPGYKNASASALGVNKLHVVIAGPSPFDE